jgi:hypothetical protein
LLGRAIHHQGFGRNAGVAAKARAKGGGALRHLDVHAGQLLGGEARAAIGFGDAVAKQAQGAHAVHQRLRDFVTAVNGFLQRDAFIADEATHLRNELFELFGVTDHGFVYGG